MIYVAYMFVSSELEGRGKIDLSTFTISIKMNHKQFPQRMTKVISKTDQKVGSVICYSF